MPEKMRKPTPPSITNPTISMNPQHSKIVATATKAVDSLLNAAVSRRSSPTPFMESGTTIPPTPSSPTDQLMSEKTRKDIIFLTNCFAGELLTSVFATTEIDQSPSLSSSTALDAVSSIKSYLPDFIDVQGESHSVSATRDGSREMAADGWLLHPLLN